VALKTENKLSRKISGPDRKGITWRNISRKELHNLYPSPDVIRVKEGEMEGV
jgi:hypothetical protein